ncbi:MAG: nitrilase-related carbon-nitrogen hydrolase [Gammaproteobacteria bacterium]
MTEDRTAFSRRRLLQSAGATLVAAAGLGAALRMPPAAAAMGDPSAPLNLRDDGTYDTVPLARDSITLTVVQSRVRAVDARSPRRGLKENLDHMLKAIDKVFHFSAPSDIVQFHEFPITGWDVWTREECLRLSIEVPGEETEAIGAKARQYGCHIVFGSYVTDPDWPNHVLSITTIIGPDGKVVDKHWKARNIKGVFPGVELYTTTIYDVLDRYVEMYGPDAVLPVTRTPVGNLATASVQREPELFRAFAMKGAEIFLRTASGGFSDIDVRACALYNGVYSTMCNNAISPDNPNFFDDPGAAAGGSMIIGPRGEELAMAREEETAISARIPLASFRQRHRQPIVHMELYRPVWDGYRNAYGPNLFADELPSDLYDAKRYLQDKSRWR